MADVGGCVAQTSVKDVFEIASYVAAIVIMCLAVSPLLNRAWYLLRTDPSTMEERTELIDMYGHGRMGSFQWAWLRFLWWVREYSTEALTWKERLARFACRIEGHEFNVSRPGKRWQGVCKKCNYISASFQMEEALRDVERRGSADQSAYATRIRGRDSLASLSAELDALKARVDAEMARRR